MLRNVAASIKICCLFVWSYAIIRALRVEVNGKCYVSYIDSLRTCLSGLLMPHWWLLRSVNRRKINQGEKAHEKFICR
jgi:hypothetical protein